MKSEKTKSKNPKREHNLNIFISYELKDQIKTLSKKYDRTTSDIVRAILRIGIPMMEGLSAAEEIMIKEYIALFRKLRQVKSLKDI